MKRFFVLLMYLLLFTSGCADDNVAPSSAVITISPEGATVTDTSTTSSWHTRYFTILVKDSKTAAPMNDVEITISFPLAVPDFSGAVQLYNGNNAVNSPFKAKTDSMGTYILRFDYISGGDSNGDGTADMAYKGDLEVRSGSVFTSVTFEVKAS